MGWWFVGVVAGLVGGLVLVNPFSHEGRSFPFLLILICEAAVGHTPPHEAFGPAAAVEAIVQKAAEDLHFSCVLGQFVSNLFDLLGKLSLR